MRNPKYYLFDILDTIDKLEKYSSIDMKSFVADEVLPSFVCFKLISLGEAMKSVSESFQTQYSDIDWKKIIGMRNVLTHDYYEMNPEIVYKTIKNDLPGLKIKVEKIVVDNGWMEEYSGSKYN